MVIWRHISRRHSRVRICFDELSQGRNLVNLDSFLASHHFLCSKLARILRKGYIVLDFINHSTAMALIVTPFLSICRYFVILCVRFSELGRNEELEKFIFCQPSTSITLFLRSYSENHIFSTHQFGICVKHIA